MSAVRSRASISRGAVWRGACAAVVIGLLGARGITGCASLPGSSSPWTVASAVERGSYLDVNLSRSGSTRRYFAPASEPCRSLLRVEAVVELVNLGPLGEFQAGGATCIPVGIGSLAAWRDERPRPKVGPLPSKQANYELVYEDQDVAMLRGMIPLLGLIAWPGMGDTLMVLPKTPACQGLIGRRVATIEYRVAGADPYVLLDGDKRCALAGLIQPIGER